MTQPQLIIKLLELNETVELERRSSISIMVKDKKTGHRIRVLVEDYD